MSKFRSDIRVSAIVSTYNAESYMQGCMEDLLRQTLFSRGELEIIIVDCNSPSDEFSIVRKLQMQHPNISYLRLSERETLYSAWNIGIKMAKGQYVTNANTDDRHSSQSLERMADVLDQNSDVSLVYADVFRSEVANETYDDNKGQIVYRYPEYFPPDVLMFCQLGCQPMWRKSIHDEIGYFDENMRAAGDYDFNLRLALSGKKLMHIPEVLGSFLERPDSISLSDQTSTNEQLQLRQKYINKENILQLLQCAAIRVGNLDEILQALHLIATRALNFTLPWKPGESYSDSPVFFAALCHAIELAPENVTLLNNFAFGLEMEGRYEDASGVWQKIETIGVEHKAHDTQKLILENIANRVLRSQTNTLPHYCTEVESSTTSQVLVSNENVHQQEDNAPTKIKTTDSVVVTHVIQGLSLGGGARCALNIAKYTSRLGSYQHNLLSLESIPTSQSKARDLAKECGMTVYEGSETQDYQALLEKSDIVHVHWWNSPIMDSFLRRPLPKSRYLAWYHVAGHHVPHVLRSELLEFFHVNLAGSPYTAEAPTFADFRSRYGSARSGMAYGPADFDRLKNYRPKSHGGFRVGYIGTVDFQKLHEQFIDMCAAAADSGIEFHVWGGDSCNEILRLQSAQRGIADKVHFRGFTTDVATALSEIDILGYPLRMDTYAASELIIQEAMYCGVVPVVFPHGGLRRLVEHNKTGLVVHSVEEYGQAIRYLRDQPEFRKRLSDAAKDYAREHFGSENAALIVHDVYQRLLELPRGARSLQESSNAEDALQGCVGATRFSLSLGQGGNVFLESMSSQNIESQCKADAHISQASFLMLAGGVEPWSAFYDKDSFLAYWSGIIHLRRGNAQAALHYLTIAQANSFPDWRCPFYMAVAADMAQYHEQANILYDYVATLLPSNYETNDILRLFNQVLQDASADMAASA